jgi:hypothetical protein
VEYKEWGNVYIEKFQIKSINGSVEIDPKNPEKWDLEWELNTIAIKNGMMTMNSKFPTL